VNSQLDDLRDVITRLDGAGIPFESSLPRGLSERERKRRITERFYGLAFADRVFPGEA
jgi:hypothetical protein